MGLPHLAAAFKEQSDVSPFLSALPPVACCGPAVHPLGRGSFNTRAPAPAGGSVTERRVWEAGGRTPRRSMGHIGPGWATPSAARILQNPREGGAFYPRYNGGNGVSGQEVSLHSAPDTAGLSWDPNPSLWDVTLTLNILEKMSVASPSPASCPREVSTRGAAQPPTCSLRRTHSRLLLARQGHDLCPSTLPAASGGRHL